MGLVFVRRRLRVIPDLSVLWIVGVILVLSVVLDRLVFRPVLAVIRQREDAVTSARALAEQAAAEARRAGDEFERRTTEARAEVYRQMDEMRRAALEDRTALIDATRKEADQALADARATLGRDVQQARARLEADADALAAEAATRILGRRAS
jgi:F-type H+-transporting ATPase subunit b